MQLPVITFLLPLISSAAALQTIRIGRWSGTCGSTTKGGSFVFWFSDSNVCTDGVRDGAPDYFTTLCGKEWTLLGHEHLEFTNCTTPPYGINLPAGVSDDGAPALTCTRHTETPVTTCEQQCTNYPNAPPIRVTEFAYCS